MSLGTSIRQLGIASLALIAAAGSSAALVGCDDRSDMERSADRAGDKMSDAADKAADKTKDAADKVGDKASDAGDKIKDASHDAADNVRDAAK